MRKMMGGASIKEPFLTLYVNRRCNHDMGLISISVSCMGLRFRVGIYPLEVYIKTMIALDHTMSRLSTKFTLWVILRDQVSIAMRVAFGVDYSAIVS